MSTDKLGKAAEDRLRNVLLSLKDKGYPVDTDLVDELKHNLTLYAKAIKGQKGIGRMFYARPEKKNLHKYHVVWADLFFDLIYVAAIFRIGTLLENVIKNYGIIPVEHVCLGLYCVVAVFICLRGTWENKLEFSCRFDTIDLFHKVSEVVEGTEM